MYLQSLESMDAELIVELAGRLHPPELHLEAEDIAEALDAAADEESNFSMGFVDGSRLHGYMLAWLEESRVEGLRESVLLIEDVVVDDTARPQVGKLFRVLVQNLEESGLTDIAIEATLLASMQPAFASHTRLFSSLGYELAASSTYEDDELGQEMIWVRYERPQQEEVPAPHDEALVHEEPS
jgi:hypothetical protein